MALLTFKPLERQPLAGKFVLRGFDVKGKEYDKEIDMFLEDGVTFREDSDVNADIIEAYTSLENEASQSPEVVADVAIVNQFSETISKYDKEKIVDANGNVVDAS